MKLFRALIFLLIIPFYINGQDFTIAELIRLNDMSLDDFDTYVSRKDFFFVNIETNGLSKNYLYGKGYGKPNPVFIGKMFPNPNLVMYAFYTQKIYLKVKEELRDNGFEFFKSETSDKSSMSYYYSDGNYVVELNLINENRENNVFYNMVLTKLKI